jgi:type IV fimbrial biogenesis protein FimT
MFFAENALRRKGFSEGMTILMQTIAREHRGFTLVELMISISIMGLITVLAVPGFTRFLQSWKLQGEANQFAATLRTARAAAVTKNINVVFTFDPDDETFFYFEDSDRDGLQDNSEYCSATYSLETGIAFAAYTLSSETLTFGSMGNTRESGSVTLRNSYNRTRTVRIYGGTGNITIE